MRVRLPSIAFAILALPLASLATFSACGGDDSGTDAGPDATTDAAKDVARLETGPDVLDAGCTNDADLTQYLPSADASIDVDAGGLNIATCTGCFKDNCGGDINACNQDCDCRQGVIDLVTCVGQATTLSTCISNALASNNSNLQGLVICAINKCAAACLPPDGGLDAAVSDAASDATGD